MDPQLPFLDTEYSRLVDLHVRARGSKWHVGTTTTPQRCRYCDQDDAATTFRTTAHAVPENTGIATVVSQDECDQCNKFFSETIEKDLACYLLPLRSITAVRGKSGYPTSKGPTAIIRPRAGSISVTPNTDDAIRVDRERKVFTIKATRQPYRPIGVYKCLAKIAVALLPPDELAASRPLVRWLLDRESSRTPPFNVPLFAIETFVPGPTRACGVFQLWKRSINNPRRPYLVFIAFFGNVAFQLPLAGAGDFGQSLPIAYPLVDIRDLVKVREADGDPRVEVLDLGSNEIIRDHVCEFSMRYTTLKDSV